MKFKNVIFLGILSFGFVHAVDAPQEQNTKKRSCDAQVCHRSTPGGQYTHPSFTDESIQPRQITSSQLEAKMKQQTNVKVVNVLGAMLYEDCSIEGSVNYPLRKLEESAKSWTDKNQEIVVYCACKECDASQKAYRLLTSMGFTNVWEYEDGIREWYREKKSTTGRCKESYLSAPTCK